MDLSEQEEQQVQDAFDSLAQAVSGPAQVSQNKHERGYLDGCYDLCHSGHFNAMR